MSSCDTGRLRDCLEHGHREPTQRFARQLIHKGPGDLRLRPPAGPGRAVHVRPLRLRQPNDLRIGDRGITQPRRRGDGAQTVQLREPSHPARRQITEPGSTHRLPGHWILRGISDSLSREIAVEQSLNELAQRSRRCHVCWGPFVTIRRQPTRSPFAVTSTADRRRYSDSLPQRWRSPGYRSTFRHASPKRPNSGKAVMKRRIP